MIKVQLDRFEKVFIKHDLMVIKISRSLFEGAVLAWDLRTYDEQKLPFHWRFEQVDHVNVYFSIRYKKLLLQQLKQ